jgi:hypothetical protein
MMGSFGFSLMSTNGLKLGRAPKARGELSESVGLWLVYMAGSVCGAALAEASVGATPLTMRTVLPALI